MPIDMDIQRLRNLTTGRLHTKMEHIYQDLERITGMDGIFTHMIPNVMRALEPWLREMVTEKRFWDGEYDPTHTGNYSIDPMTKVESIACLKRFGALPSPLVAKDVLVISTDVGEPDHAD